MVFTPSVEGDTKVIIDIGGSGAEGTIDFNETLDRESLPSGAANRGTMMPLSPVKESQEDADFHNTTAHKIDMFSTNNKLIKLEHTAAIAFDKNRLSMSPNNNRNNLDSMPNSHRTESAFVKRQMRSPSEKIQQHDLEVQTTPEK